MKNRKRCYVNEINELVKNRDTLEEKEVENHPISAKIGTFILFLTLSL